MNRPMLHATKNASRSISQAEQLKTFKGRKEVAQILKLLKGSLYTASHNFWGDSKSTHTFRCRLSIRSASASSRPVSCRATTSSRWSRSRRADRPTGQGLSGETTPSLTRYSKLFSFIYMEGFQLFLTHFAFAQMFFYNVHMLPSDLFEQNISFRVSRPK